MRKGLIVTITVVTAVLVAVPAQAKEFKSVKVCGQKGCAKTTDRGLMMGFLSEDGSPNDPPPAGPFYSVRLSVSDGKQVFHWWIDYAPEANMIRTDSDYGEVWHSLPTPSKEFTAFLGKVNPYPAKMFGPMLKESPGAITWDKTFGEKTTVTYESDPDTVAKSDPQPARPVSSPSSGINPLVPILVILGLAGLATAAVAIQRRRAEDAVTGS